ncbi:hypothetical protein Rhopal_007073-T1 [Rhodotorula paludigena]|uniref:TMS membrane protein/tumor differentially expressed protein n=1 Tax=Rhodotorula paludigena TaxID=86838 RepID=A0AAV5GN57_9BASI|nr:hypothetical protein Rhopal_007073-T1 [Rhodotorula paludigena]
MGALLSIPFLGSIGGLGASALSACVTGVAFFCTGQAASALTRSCNCNSSVATRVGYSLIFLLNSLLAWVMLTDWAIRLVAKWSFDWIKMECSGGKCYGVLAVHRICFALAMFHAVLSLSLIGVKDTRTKRAAIQNGWWGPKVLAWLALVALSFLVPNGFFIHFWATYVSLPGSMAFILIGLVLLVDFAHTWSETCLERWEHTDSPLWKWVLIGSTLGLYALSIALTVVQYVFFAGAGCGLNTALISLNWVASLAVSALSVAPAVQESNPRSGLAQSGMVVAYTAYLTTSAIANHDDEASGGRCNPLQSRAAGARTGMVVLGAVFTFLAIAYSTSRAATQSKAFVPGKGRPSASEGYEALSTGAGDGGLEAGELETVVRTQPRREDSLRYQAIKAAVEEGSLPASALDEDSDDEGDGAAGGMSPVNDDEKTGTRYNYSYFHVIFVLATMYTACLLTKSVVSTISNVPSDGTPVRIGRSHVAFWMRVVSSWVCLALYGWSLAAPLVLPDRF